jgi:hypothetical protein
MLVVGREVLARPGKVDVENHGVIYKLFRLSKNISPLAQLSEVRWGEETIYREFIRS